jgi:hypothetical protein
MEENENILDEIFVDKNEPVDKKMLVEILKGFVTIDQEGILNFSDKYDALIGHKKVLIYLCAKKAMVLKGIEAIKEFSSQSEVSERSHVTLDVARNAIHKKYKKLLKKEGEGYIIPNYNLRKVKEILEEKND